MFIDFHTHKPTAEGIITPRSFGIHPWDAELAGPPTSSWASFSPNDCKSNNSSSAQPPTYSRFVAAEIIGECGLDKACGVDWEKQIELFRWQIEIAVELQKPMVIHCVRAMNEVIAMRREARSPFSVLRCRLSRRHATPFHVSPWVIHGFIGNIQQAEQLFRAGIWVSFGAAILDPRREKVRHCLAEIKSPFLLETDESDCGIAAIYEEAAKLRNSSLEALSDTIKHTYDTLINL